MRFQLVPILVTLNG